MFENSPLVDLTVGRSTVRQRILALLMTGSASRLHLREIQRRAGTSPGTASRELARLVAAGLVDREAEGHQVYFRASGSPFAAMLRSLLIAMPAPEFTPRPSDIPRPKRTTPEKAAQPAVDTAEHGGQFGVEASRPEPEATAPVADAADRTAGPARTTIGPARVGRDIDATRRPSPADPLPRVIRPQIDAASHGQLEGQPGAGTELDLTDKVALTPAATPEPGTAPAPAELTATTLSAAPEPGTAPAAAETHPPGGALSAVPAPAPPATSAVTPSPHTPPDHLGLSIASRLGASLRSIYGDDLRGIYLYGARSSGPAAADADVETIVVLDRVDHYGAELERTSQICAALSHELNVVVSRVFMTEADWNAGPDGAPPQIRGEAVAV